MAEMSCRTGVLDINAAAAMVSSIILVAVRVKTNKKILNLNDNNY